MNYIDTAKTQIDRIIQDACAAAAQKGLLPSAGPLSGSVEIPRDLSHGDYAANHAMAAARVMHMSPAAIAKALLECMDLTGTYVGHVEIAGPGFMNFTLNQDWYSDIIRNIQAEGPDFGRSDIGKGEKVMVEFVSANPTGPMTIGNARGGVLGDALASVLDRAGYSVWREFYVNNAGNQVDLFGRSIEARYLQLILGEDAVEFPDNGYHGDDIRELAAEIREKYGDAYVSADPEERRKTFIAYALPRNIERMKQDLARYRIHFDQWFLESDLHDSGYVAETVDLLTKNGYTYEKDGALWLNNTALGIRPENLHFLIMQMVRLTRDGETIKVSKRTGKALTLSDLLDEISCDACRFFFNAKPDTHLEFDLGLAVRQDSENLVYYVQYAHARICSLIAALAAEGHSVGDAGALDLSVLSSDTERDLIRQLSLLPEEIKLSARDMDPSRINRYVIEVAARFHRFYNACRIKGEAEDVLGARLKLADVTRQVIRNCLEIIGVTAPEKM